MRLFTGNPHLLPHASRFPHLGPRSAPMKAHHPGALRSPAARNRYGYEHVNDVRAKASPHRKDVSRYWRPPLSRAFLLERLRQINRLSDVAMHQMHRKKRSLVFDTDELSVPFFKVEEEEDFESSEEVSDDSDEMQDIYSKDRVAQEYLQPFSVEHMIPHSPLFYFLNAPIRILSHFNNLKNHLKPVFHSVPLIMQNSKNYIRDLCRQFHTYILHFFSNVIGNFDDLSTSRGHMDVLLPNARYRRSMGRKNQTAGYAMQSAKNATDVRRKKRFILKMVDDKEVEDFLRDKLGDLNEGTDKEDVVKSALHQNATENRRKKARRKYVIQPLTPKIIVDNNGKTFVELDGMKRPLLSSRRNKQQLHTPSQQMQVESVQDDLNRKISSLIEQAKVMAAQKVDVPSNAYDSSMYLQIIKEKITQILNNIEKLINTDFGKYIEVYEELLKLQNMKNLITDEWKQLLITNRCNDMDGKIRILNVFQQIQANREKILQMIASTMLEEQNFMTPKLIKALVRLQKLQCIVVRIVEDFASTLHLRTLFDAQKEVKYVEYLQSIYLIPETTQEDIETSLKGHRDQELEKQVRLLENLRRLIETGSSGDAQNEDAINEHAKILWEIKNIEKLQKDSIAELDRKIRQGQKIRKELKILFDLQRQLENAENKQTELIDKSKESEEENASEEEPLMERTRKPKENVKRHTLRMKENSKSNKFKIWPMVQSKLAPRSGKDRKPVKIITNGYTLTGYLTHNNSKN